MTRRRILKFYVLFLIGCLFLNSQFCAAQTDIYIRKNGKLNFLRTDDSIIASINIEIAETPEGRTRGLMGRELSDFLSGMLFVYQGIRPRNFWMRNTPGSLDIIFVGEDFRIINIAENTKPMSDTIYSSASPAKYVVEVKAGFAKQYEIKAGHKINWERL